METKLLITRYSEPIAPFPLTPALSLRERGCYTPSAEHSWDARLGYMLPTILPLPKGEGRGEGEQGGRIAVASPNAPGTLRTAPQILVALAEGVCPTLRRGRNNRLSRISVQTTLAR